MKILLWRRLILNFPILVGEADGVDVDRERGVYFKDLARVAVGAGTSEICRAGQPLETQGAGDL